jgi:hypothetical protein
MRQGGRGAGGGALVGCEWSADGCGNRESVEWSEVETQGTTITELEWHFLPRG